MFTKHVSADELLRHLKSLNFQSRNDRASKALEFANVTTTKNQQGVNAQRDEWTKDSQCVTRLHHRPRRKLFHPFQVADSNRLGELTSTSVTHGQFVAAGSKFMRQDNWTNRATSDIDLGAEWIGRTVFIPKTNGTRMINGLFSCTAAEPAEGRHVLKEAEIEKRPKVPSKLRSKSVTNPTGCSIQVSSGDQYRRTSSLEGEVGRELTVRHPSLPAMSSYVCLPRAFDVKMAPRAFDVKTVPTSGLKSHRQLFVYHGHSM